MSLLVNLILRIFSGERLERSSRESVTAWLSFLATMPVAIAFVTAAVMWVEEATGFGLDSHASVIVVTLFAGLCVVGLWAACAKIFRRIPQLLIPLAAVTWAGGAWLVLTKMSP